ncbi:MAG: diaminopimelate epimerase [Actinomycetales bacterium]
MSLSLPFAKGHGTENDFVIVPDPDGDLELTPGDVQRICERRAGIGADGLIRVVRTEAMVAAGELRASAAPAQAEWFMDYRNADGSVAEMCGNGVRVFAEYLLREGYLRERSARGGSGVPLATRGGLKRVRLRTDGWWAVDMGEWDLPGGAQALERGFDAEVHLGGLDVSHPALSLDLGNPHTVVMLAENEDLDDVDLTRAPVVEPVPATGTNVEVLHTLEPEERDQVPVGRLRMRVHERGVGETRSCGTGACAAAAAAALWAGSLAPARWLIDVPGGQVEVRLGPGMRVELAGPAVLVADGYVSLDW